MASSTRGLEVLLLARFVFVDLECWLWPWRHQGGNGERAMAATREFSLDELVGWSTG
ncbi:hypothetical protein Patl1_19230 [Pistacia atlantica]|uniref:Uncharacterized protein n=1 Tax=Pistacia atlantica TaxID=434234 RepID=A0ACC1BZV3_9ROSI|nr:hypothetical protein Patl1_19230 [Pistacia atlantica]